MLSAAGYPTPQRLPFGIPQAHQGAVFGQPGTGEDFESSLEVRLGFERGHRSGTDCDLGVLPAEGNKVASRVDRNRSNCAWMFHHRSDFFAGHHGPEADAPILPTRHEQLTIGPEGERPNTAFVKEDSPDGFAGVGLPKANCSVVTAAGNDAIAVGAQSNQPSSVLDGWIDQVGCRQRPEMDWAVAAGRQQPLAIRVEVEVCDDARVVENRDDVPRSHRADGHLLKPIPRRDKLSARVERAARGGPLAVVENTEELPIARPEGAEVTVLAAEPFTIGPVSGAPCSTLHSCTVDSAVTARTRPSGLKRNAETSPFPSKPENCCRRLPMGSPVSADQS